MADKQATAVAANEQHTILVSRWADPWLVGGLGIVAWVLFSLPQWGVLPQFSAIVSGPLYWLLLATTGAHFGVSYHLGYGQGREIVLQRWPLLVAAPIALFVISLAFATAALSGATEVANQGVRFLLTAVFSLTSWHYIKQVYGIARLGGSLHSLSFDSIEVRILRYGLYPLWFWQASRIWAGTRGRSFNGLEAGYNLLPSAVVDGLQLVTYLSVGLLMVAFVKCALRWSQIPPAMIWTPYAVGFLWFLFPPNFASTVLVFGALHGLQYLACAHRAEMAWGFERGVDNTVWWWSSVFGGALATGMLLVYWLPQLLTDATAATTLGAIPATLLFVFFNLHHYAVDASIWRFDGGHIRRVTKGPRARSSSRTPELASN